MLVDALEGHSYGPVLLFPNLFILSYFALITLYTPSRYSILRWYSVHVAHCLTLLAPLPGTRLVIQIESNIHSSFAFGPTGREQPLTRLEPWKRIWISLLETLYTT
jgi:hypothetical protein